jgi:hypothetical protein
VFSGGEVIPFAPKITPAKVVRKVGGDGRLLTTAYLTSHAVVVITPLPSSFVYNRSTCRF